MWYDDFDAELYKVVPRAQVILAPVAGVELKVSGRPDQDGKLNHPSFWNGDTAMIGFCGLRDSCRGWKPEIYYDGGAIVRCTLEELIRDTWVHSCVMHFHMKPLWNSWALRHHFETLMYKVRKWDDLLNGRNASVAEIETEAALLRFVDAFKAAFPDQVPA